jgi:hypothetical protein
MNAGLLSRLGHGAAMPMQYAEPKLRRMRIGIVTETWPPSAESSVSD